MTYPFEIQGQNCITEVIQNSKILHGFLAPLYEHNTNQNSQSYSTQKWRTSSDYFAKDASQASPIGNPLVCGGMTISTRVIAKQPKTHA
jgi:hypothetical protein